MATSASLTAIKVFTVVLPATFITAALTHLGIRVPIGIEEPRIVPAAVVESLIAFGFVIAAIGVFTRAGWAWAACLVADVIGMAGVLLGIAALAAGRGPTTTANYIYHRVVLSVMFVAFIFLVTPIARRVLGTPHEAGTRLAVPK